VGPASVCGLSLPELRATLPRRVPSTHLVYHGARIVLQSVRHGSQLTFHTPVDDTNLARYLAPLDHLLTRPVNPVRQIDVERIQGQPASASPYADALRTAFDVRRDHHNLILLRRA
jgi:ATP-dependent Lhr-like helicase